MNYNDHRVSIWDEAAPVRRWNHDKHCRKKFQKDFLRWYAANEELFAIKLGFLRRTDRLIELRFCRAIAAPSVWVNDNEIRVAVDWADKFWDLIIEIETFPRRVPGGYVCDQCPKNTRATFPTRQVLWRDEVFEAFLQWVKNDFAKASACRSPATRIRHYANTRKRLSVAEGRPVSLVNGAAYGIGTLELVSLQTLRERLRAEAGPGGRSTVSLISGHVRHMHRWPENAGALFQVASQFNLLEMASYSVSPEQGVTRYQNDHTQGPACAIACGAVTIYRNYFVPVGDAEGQTATATRWARRHRRRPEPSPGLFR